MIDWLSSYKEFVQDVFQVLIFALTSVTSNCNIFASFHECSSILLNRFHPSFTFHMNRHY